MVRGPGIELDVGGCFLHCLMLVDVYCTAYQGSTDRYKGGVSCMLSNEVGVMHDVVHAGHLYPWQRMLVLAGQDV